MNYNGSMSVYADRNSPEANAVTLILTLAFVGFLPFLLLIVVYYIARKTDNRLPQSAIQQSLVWLSGVCVFGSITMTFLVLLLQAVQKSIENATILGVLQFLFKRCLFFLMDGPLITLTIFHYFVFLCAFQRLLLITKVKLGMTFLTGRRLRFKIFILFCFALISAINRIVGETRVPWIELVTLIVTIIMYLCCAFFVQHIERRMIANAHIIVLVQTVPLVLLLAVFTIGDYYVTSSGQKLVTPQAFRVLAAFTLSFTTPLFLILGSPAKRRIMASIIICQYESRVGRGELYTSERTPMDTSNAVSMAPTTRF